MHTTSFPSEKLIPKVFLSDKFLSFVGPNPSVPSHIRPRGFWVRISDPINVNYLLLIVTKHGLVTLSGNCFFFWQHCGERRRGRERAEAGGPCPTGFHGGVRRVPALQVGGEQHVRPFKDQHRPRGDDRRRKDEVLQGRPAHLPLRRDIHIQRIHRRPRRMRRQDQPRRAARQSLHPQLRDMHGCVLKKRGASSLSLPFWCF